MGKIKTSDLPLAASICVVSGAKVKQIDNDELNQSKKWFLLESEKYSNEQFQSMSTDFFNNSLMVDARSYAFKMKTLKQMIFSIKENEIM